MSDNLQMAGRKFDKFRARKPQRAAEIDDFRLWLEGLSATNAPKIHVNGTNHAQAVVVVDFGTPLTDPVKLTSEQAADLIGHLRSSTKSLYRSNGTEVSVRVQNDASTGIWWSSVG